MNASPARGAFPPRVCFCAVQNAEARRSQATCDVIAASLIDSGFPTTHMMKFLWLFTAGGVGTLARFGLSTLVHRYYGGELPLGTFVVNVVGCLLFGFVWTLADERLVISGETRFLILTGFMGAFTTFSTFAFESTTLLRDSEWFWAAGNALAHTGVGFAAVLIGMALGNLL